MLWNGGNIVRSTTVYENNNLALLLANDTVAENFSQEFIDEFMKERNENVIFIVYHVKDSIILLHFKILGNETNFDSAIQLVKNDILMGNLCSDDENLQKALNDPQATTAKFLLDFISMQE